jgi:glycosyltransferase involved in cell wall biosynthesis
MKPRGLIFIHQFRPVASGAELQAERLAIKLVEMGHPMQVLTQLRTPDSLAEENFSGVQVHRVQFPLAYTMQDGVETFRYLVKQRHTYDVIHVQQAFGHAVVSVIAARSFGKKCIIKIACAGGYGDLSVFSGFEGFGQALEILHQADRVVAISREVEEELLTWGFQAERVIRIPNGVDTQYFQRCQPMPEWKKVRFILIGRRTPQKGIDLALQSAKHLVEQGLDERFEIKFYGFDYPEYDYRAMAQELGVMPWVEFLPHTQPEAMLDVYQSGNCLILPSRGEGLSNALLEAMAVELPIIATAVSGTVDVMEDGQEGLLIPCDSSEALTKAMATIIQKPNLAQRLGQQARHKVVRAFSLESVAQQYSALYHQLH